MAQDDLFDEILAQACNGFLFALDRTGTSQTPLPGTLADAGQPPPVGWLWGDGMQSPLDTISEFDKSTVVAAFLDACDSGFSSCAVDTVQGGAANLMFWNQLREHDCIVVLLTLETHPEGGRRADPSDVAPLRLAYTLSLDGRIESIDDAARAVLGWDESVIGASVLSLAEVGMPGLTGWREVLLHPSRSYRSRLRLRCADGSWRKFDATTKNRLDEDGHIHVELIDITQYVGGHPDIEPMIQLCDDLAQLITEPVLFLDAQMHVLACTKRFTQLTRVHFNAKTRQMEPPPRFIAAPLRTLVQQVLATGDQQVPRQAFVSHANVPLRLEATSGRFGSNRYCVVRAFENLSDDKGRSISKGLAPSTLGKIVSALVEETAPMSTAALAELTGLSQVTVRRYIRFLVTRGDVEVHRLYGSPGRPRQSYSINRSSAPADNRPG